MRQGGLSRRGYLGRYRVGGLQLFGDYFWQEAQKLAVKTGMGCSLLFMHPQITEAELACLFLEVMERFKGTDAGKVVFKVQRDMEVLGK